ncbi:MAG: phosphate ABC transporter permease PstA [Trueperaceae bacterium]|nr:phosphate ABC transporter permease PstA [Trueperaceae bacterium]
MSLAQRSDADRRRQAAKRARGRAFVAITFVPVVLALALVATLFTDVITDTVSWQIVEPAQTTASWSFAEGFAGLGTWEHVVEMELEARGVDPSTILEDPEERRKFRLRNRVELLWSLNGERLRWVVTNSRDDTVEDYGYFEGLRELDAIRAEVGEGQELRLNPWLDLAFFTKNASRTPVMAGLGNALLGTLWVIGLVILFSLPIGVGSAIYLEEYAPDNRVTRFIELNIRNLAGVPSVVYGILGLYAFVRVFEFGPTVLSAALTLSLLILPVVIIASREAIKAVPPSLREASYGLGASKWQTTSRVVLPNAIAGITTGMILAVARAIGETAPLLLVGAAAFIPRAPDGPLSTYTVVPIQIYSWVAENDVEFAHVASAGILTLLMVLLVLYGAAFYLRRRFERSW